MKRRKYLTTLFCLAAGVLILSGAAYANYDNAIGYSTLKNAAKSLLYEKNFSADLEVSLDMNGTLMVDAVVNGKFALSPDGLRSEDAYSLFSGSNTYDKKGNLVESFEDGTREVAYDGSVYTQYSGQEWFERSYSGSPLPSLDNDETAAKTVRFLELLADTMVGDLKNNFVLTKNDGNFKTYAVNLQREQIPELINAGLSMIFAQINDSRSMSNASFVTSEYDTEDRTLAEARHAEVLHEEAWRLLEEKGHKGIVKIERDGSFTYYPTYAEYRKSFADSDDFDYDALLAGSDPYISHASCIFTIDEQGRLVDSTMKGTLSMKDEMGQVRSFTLTMKSRLYDYGTTVPDRLPKGAQVVDGKWKSDYDPERVLKATEEKEGPELTNPDGTEAAGADPANSLDSADSDSSSGPSH